MYRREQITIDSDAKHEREMVHDEQEGGIRTMKSAGSRGKVNEKNQMVLPETMIKAARTQSEKEDRKMRDNI